MTNAESYAIFAVRVGMLLIAAWAIIRHPRLDKSDRMVAISVLCVLASS